MKPFAALPLLILLPSAAMAHPLAGGAPTVALGFAHTWSGLDHWLVMLGVGLWAGQQGGRSTWGLPLAFVLALLLGIALGSTGAPIMTLELALAVSVVLSGVLIAAAASLSLPLSASLVGAFALLHGYAHGLELGIAPGAVAPVLGTALAAGLCLTLGCSLGIAMERSAARLQLGRQTTSSWALTPARILRLGGGVLAAAGVLLAGA